MKLGMIILLMVLLVGPVQGFKIWAPPSLNYPGVRLTTLFSSYQLDKQDNAHVSLFGELEVPRNVSMIKVEFNPHPSSHSPPIENLKVYLCEKVDSYSVGPTILESNPCPINLSPSISTRKLDRNSSADGKELHGDFFEYVFTFNITEWSKERWLLPKIVVTYDQRLFTFSQGDYEVAWIISRGMEGTGVLQLTNYLTLPGNEYIPRFIPPNANLSLLEEVASKKPVWSFEFKGTSDPIVWFQNDAKIKAQERKLQNEYFLKGVIASILVGIVFFLLERLLFHETSTKSNWIKSWGKKINQFRSTLKKNRKFKGIFDSLTEVSSEFFVGFAGGIGVLIIDGLKIGWDPYLFVIKTVVGIMYLLILLFISTCLRHFIKSLKKRSS